MQVQVQVQPQPLTHQVIQELDHPLSEADEQSDTDSEINDADANQF